MVCQSAASIGPVRRQLSLSPALLIALAGWGCSNVVGAFHVDHVGPLPLWGRSTDGRRRTSVALEQSKTLQIPIFPLSKKARLPTEPLTLNLYEERYLQMAEFTLASPTPHLFGCLYTADKPHVVQRKENSDELVVIPMVEPGDIGVVCLLHHYDIRDADRPHIRLEATLTVRFQIERLVQYGYRRGSDNGTVPFIMARVRLVTDHLNELDATEGMQDASTRTTAPLATRTLQALACHGVELPSENALVWELQSFCEAAHAVPETACQPRLASLACRDAHERRQLYANVSEEPWWSRPAIPRADG